jgi:hypothetical protein
VPKLLVIALAEVPDDLLDRSLGPADRASAEVRVVSPVSKLSPLQWLTNEEDAAREQAEAIAAAGAERVAGEADVDDAGAGDTDPVQAAEDALRTFDADQIVVVVPRDEEASWLERASLEDGFERFGRPVRYVAGE